MIEFQKRGPHKNFHLLVKCFVFSPILTLSNFSAHGYYNLTKFGEDWTKKSFTYIGEHFCEDLFKGIL